MIRSEMECSVNEQLKCLVNREFENYIPVPSVAEASRFQILHFCFPILAEQSFITYIWKGERPETIFVSFGSLFDYCSLKKGEKISIKKEPVFNHNQASGSNLLRGEIQGKTLEVAKGHTSTSVEKNKDLDLGEIIKHTLCYKEISYWLSRATKQNSPELIEEAKRNPHLYVIYECLTAEYLNMKAQETVDTQGSVSAELQNVGVKGTGTSQRTRSSNLSRTKKMGRYPIAFKCGRVRYSMKKKCLKLAGLKEFYKPFQLKLQIEPCVSDQSQSSSQDEGSQDHQIQ